MKNIVFDLGGVVVDWNPQRLLKEYPGDKALPFLCLKRDFFRSIGWILTGERCRRKKWWKR